MKLFDVMEIMKPFDAKIITGKNELNRKVLTIEVMEVPEVDQWVREGLLMITTFYSVKNDHHKQYEIILELINRKAAGIIIKIGRFIPNVPAEIIKLANHNNFPIIILPKDVPYNDILLPLNKRLYSFDSTKTTDEKIIGTFDNMPFSKVEDAIEYLSVHLDCTVYIEDRHGRLLYSTKRLLKDGWRDSQLLFSKPTYQQYLKSLKQWEQQKDSNMYYVIKNKPGQKNRIVIPLNIRFNQIVFIHCVPSHREPEKVIENEFVRVIKSKISSIIMGEMIDLQQIKMAQEELLHSMKLEREHKYILLYFDRDLNDFYTKQTHSLIYYQCLFRKSLSELAEQLDYVTKYIVFEREKKTYILLRYSQQQFPSVLSLRNDLCRLLKKSTINDSYISISAYFHNLEKLNKYIDATNNILSIGKEMNANEKVYSQNKFGIYEFLIKLSTDEDVKQYANVILSPLKQSDPVLLETLTVYLQENGNASQTAKKLHVNRRTVTYRLQRIKELLATELDDGEIVFILYFCLKILNLSK